MTVSTDGIVYLQNYLGSLYSYIPSWTASTMSFIEQEAADLYGVANINDVTDTIKFNALLRFKAIERFLIEVTADYNYSADGESFSRSNVFTQAEKMYKIAIKDALPYLPEGQIQIGSMDFGRNPYARSQVGNGNADMTPVVDDISRTLGTTKP